MAQICTAKNDGPGPLVQAAPLEVASVDWITFDDLVLDQSLPLVAVRIVDRSAMQSVPARADGTSLTELQCEV